MGFAVGYEQKYPRTFRTCLACSHPDNVNAFDRLNPGYFYFKCNVCGREEMTVSENMPDYAHNALVAPKPEIRMDQRAKRIENMYRAVWGVVDDDE